MTAVHDTEPILTIPIPERADGREHVCASSHEGVFVNGVRIDALGVADFLARLDEFLACGRSHVIHFLAAHPTVEARTDGRYRHVLNQGKVNLPDGLPVVWAGRIMGTHLSRLTGTDGMQLVSRWGLDRALAHFCYGGTTDTLALLQDGLATRFPGIRIVDAVSPPFRELSDDELAEDARRIRDAGTQALWIGLGAPKQDLIAQRLESLEAAPLIFCVGAAFDFVAGNKRRAPAWARAVGLEWLFRLASEPSRLWKRYLSGNPRFVAGGVTDRIRGDAATGWG